MWYLCIYIWLFSMKNETFASRENADSTSSTVERSHKWRLTVACWVGITNPRTGNQFQPASTSFNQFQPVSTSFNQFQPVATSFNQFQPVSTSFNQLQPASTSFNQLQPASTSFNQLQPVSTSFNQFQPASTSFNQFQPVSTSFNQFQPVWTSFNQFQPVSTSFNQFQPPRTGLGIAELHWTSWVLVPGLLRRWSHVIVHSRKSWENDLCLCDCVDDSWFEWNVQFGYGSKLNIELNGEY